MREILFKAKRIDNGEWVYGNYAFTDTNGEQHFIFQNKAFEHEVDKDTICQYTGLNDRNGNMIWENDILMSGEPYIPTIPFSVRFNCKTLAVVGFYDDYEKEFSLNADLLSSCEVIGNVFDGGY